MTPEQFEKAKIEVVKILRHLQNRVDICVENGMLDINSVLYNHVDDLIEDVPEIETPAELTEIILKGKVVENNLDRWLISKGQTTVSLSWPYLEEEEE